MPCTTSALLDVCSARVIKYSQFWVVCWRMKMLNISTAVTVLLMAGALGNEFQDYFDHLQNSTNLKPADGSFTAQPQDAFEKDLAEQGNV